MLWSNHYRTPRSVWTVSAIAAALLHGGLIWWGMSAWQNRRPTLSPSPIRVIALPPESETVFEPTLPTSPAPPTASPSDAALPPQPASFEPVPPSDSGPPASNPASPSAATAAPSSALPVEPVAPEPAPNSVPTTPPVAPVSPSSPSPVPPTESVSPVREPVAPAPADRDRPFPVTTGELAPRDSGVQAFWTLQEVPGGADLPEELPRLPSGWRESTAALLANADCAAGLVPPGTTVRVTLWPIVETDGSISSFLSWDGGGNEGKAVVVNCVESLGPRMAPLIPARSGGEAIASYAMLLVVELQGIE